MIISMDQKCLISNLYLPSINILSAISHCQTILIDGQDDYQKQTYRNRTLIVGANGVQTLTVPVVGGHRMGMNFRDVKIAYDTRWQQIHWGAITSAYKSSPFFEYYQDGLAPFYHQQHQYLFDFNLHLFEFLMDALDFYPLKVLSVAQDINIVGIVDFRFMANCKDETSTMESQTPYWQVFQAKHSFTPNLSVLDLICNLGSESYLYLDALNKQTLK